MVDVLVRCADEQIKRLGLVKGAMKLTDARSQRRALSACPGGQRCPGGSAANTMADLARLGARAAYLGKVRDDELGRFFQAEMEKCGVHQALAPAAKGPPTGSCLVLVSDDAERTMQTYLGISAVLHSEEIEPEIIENCRVLYLEGYLYDRRPARLAMERAARLARAAGALVTLNLSDSFCVHRHYRDFLRLSGLVDGIFGNASEIMALAGESDLYRAVAAVAERCPLVVATRGANGALVVYRGTQFAVSAQPVEKAVDTTGAGDAYAAGFLFGLARGWPIDNCAHLAAATAAQIITQFGARAETSLEHLAKKFAP